MDAVDIAVVLDAVRQVQVEIPGPAFLHDYLIAREEECHIQMGSSFAQQPRRSNRFVGGRPLQTSSSYRCCVGHDGGATYCPAVVLAVICRPWALRNGTIRCVALAGVEVGRGIGASAAAEGVGAIAASQRIV